MNLQNSKVCHNECLQYVITPKTALIVYHWVNNDERKL